MAFHPGARVTPMIQLRRELGEGAMGSIWEADHLQLGRQVAIKFVSPTLAQENPQAYDRFKREAEVLVGFHHPNVVQFIEEGTTSDGHPFIVLELLAGGPLVDYLETDGVLTMDEMARLMDQLGSALFAIHQQGIIHRDVKAENLFVTGSEETLAVKLYDFGLAKKPDEEVQSKKLTGLGMVVGTAEYMSPEQIVSSRDADHHADLWALAVVAYVSLVASLPFHGKNLGETFALVKGAQFERPSHVRDDVPAAIDRWFERAFHIDRGNRFNSAAEMVAAWHQAAAGQAPSLPGGAPAQAPAGQVPAGQPPPGQAPPAQAPAAQAPPAQAPPAQAPGLRPPQGMVVAPPHPATQAHAAAPPVAPGQPHAMGQPFGAPAMQAEPVPSSGSSKAPIIAAVVVLIAAIGGLLAWLL